MKFNKFNSINHFSNTCINNQKYSFLNTYLSPKSNESRLERISKLKSLSLNKKKLHSSEIMPPTIFRSISRAKQNITLVKLLNIEDNFNTILSTDKEMERQKEKLNNNNLIKLVRLGLYKKKENDDDNNNNETDKNEAETIAEKEKKNEENLEKINNENREREERVKRIFKEKLGNLEKVKTECQKLNQKINKINESIEEYQMEVNVLVTYSDEFDEKFLKNLNNQNQNDNDSIDNDYFSLSPNKNNEMHERTKAKNKHLDQMNKLAIYKQQRDDKRRDLSEMITQKENIKKELEKNLIIKREKCNQAKKELYNIRKQLINIYHIKLYEGLDYGNEGLISIIKDIWNLGVNVNNDFMPTYLDDACIEFLLNRAKHSIEISKIRQVISDNQKEYVSYLKEWRVNSNELNTLSNGRNNPGLTLPNEGHKNIMKSSTDESDLFKTKLSDISISYLDPYPKTKEFMIKYKKKKLFKEEIPEYAIKHMKFKSMNIPIKILEKNKHIDKLKFLLQTKIEQNKQLDKKEVERLNKEFIKNQYKEIFKVNVETLFGALFGDKKNEMINYYEKLEKEFRDGNKIIQFHQKFKIKV